MDLVMSAKAQALRVPIPDELQGPLFPPQGRWTYEDYRRLPDDGRRYEVLRGVLYVTAAPNVLHQTVLRNVVRLLIRFLDEKPLGDFLFSPVDLILPAGLSAPVQPDLVYSSRGWREQMTSQFLEGVPDLVLEVLSPSTRRYDRRTKLEVYATAGVQEYWLADPSKRTFEVLVLRNGSYEVLGLFGAGGRARSEVLPGFEPAVDQIFQI
jgi:Uma2 family endonuclease